jgi:hypothetical protein
MHNVVYATGITHLACATRRCHRVYANDIHNTFGLVAYGTSHHPLSHALSHGSAILHGPACLRVLMACLSAQFVFADVLGFVSCR